MVRALAGCCPPVSTSSTAAASPAIRPRPTRLPGRPARRRDAVDRRPARLVELPVGATEDRVIGSLHLEQALAEGVTDYEPGLLAAAHRGLLYVDEVNLLHDHLVDLLLDAAAMGRATVEREGVSVARRPVRAGRHHEPRGGRAAPAAARPVRADRRGRRRRDPGCAPRSSAAGWPTTPTRTPSPPRYADDERDSPRHRSGATAAAARRAARRRAAPDRRGLRGVRGRRHARRHRHRARRRRARRLARPRRGDHRRHPRRRPARAAASPPSQPVRRARARRGAAGAGAQDAPAARAAAPRTTGPGRRVDRPATRTSAQRPPDPQGGRADRPATAAEQRRGNEQTVGAGEPSTARVRSPRRGARVDAGARRHGAVARDHRPAVAPSASSPPSVRGRPACT